MNPLDWILVGVMLLSLAVGWWRGLVREILSLAFLLAAFYLAWLAREPLGRHLHTFIDSLPVARVLAMVLTATGVLLIGVLVTWVVRKTLLRPDALRQMDRVLGASFGLLRGMVVSAFFVGVLTLNNWWAPQRSGSLLSPFLGEVWRLGLSLVSEDVPVDWLKLEKPDLPVIRTERKNL